MLPRMRWQNKNKELEMTKTNDISMYRRIRQMMLTCLKTGRPVSNPWYLAGLNKADKVRMMHLVVEQVYLIHDYYNDGVMTMTWKQAVIQVKKSLSGIKKKWLLELHQNAAMKFDFIEDFFLSDAGLQRCRWTKKLEEVSPIVVANCEEEDLAKFVKKDGKYYKYTHARKMVFIDTNRTEYLKSGKERRFNIINEIIGDTENKYLTDYMYLEQLVDFYKNFKHPYGEMMLALNSAPTAPYKRTKAYELLKEFWTESFINIFGLKDTGFADRMRDIGSIMDAYNVLDMLLRERKRGYSVQDVLNR